MFQIMQVHFWISYVLEYIGKSIMFLFTMVRCETIREYGQFPFISKLCDYLMTMNNLPSGTMFNLGITSIMHIPAEWSSFGFCIIFVSLMIYKDPKKINIWIKELNWMSPFLELIIRST